MEVHYYITDEGNKPVTEWLEGLKDGKAKAAVSIRLARIELNLFGDTKSLGDGVYELRIDVGPGYRVYYAQSGKDVVLLLCGGDKSAQQKDIRVAKEYWNNHKERNKKVKNGASKKGQRNR